ncbi:hypothetical protein O3P69_003147 [Scylla paramamosain]|uniref:Uncharacterized protein n=1 Tax=Scylla paramamosain TaxID=85552 RepID=A0AAW0UKQ4_SCYPA
MSRDGNDNGDTDGDDNDDTRKRISKQERKASIAPAAVRTTRVTAPVQGARAAPGGQPLAEEDLLLLLLLLLVG